MNLTQLELKNYRRFDDLTISFHPELTVIVARNGQGKTSILDAATTVLGPFVGAFDLGKSKHIEVKDARYLRKEGRSDSEQQFPVELTADVDPLDEPITRELNGVKSKTTTKGSASLNDFGKDLMDQVRALEDINLPMLAYYGSGRLWNSHKNMQRKSVLSESRSMGYEDCFSSASSFTQVQQWMSKATFAALQQQSMEAYDGYPLQDQIDGIQKTVDSVLKNQEWSGFHYSMQHEELAMKHPQFGILPVSLLSDGVRAMVSLVADMAWRCAKLNPHLGKEAQEKTEGIVFIDEVDMHLHPSWQQQVIASLRDAFPKIQYIVSTHSPQVLSTVSRESIRKLVADKNGKTNAEIPLMHSYGMESQSTLQGIMGVDPQPPVAEKMDLEKLTAMIESGNHKSHQAQQLLTSLTESLGDQHPQIARLIRSIRRMETLNR